MRSPAWIAITFASLGFAAHGNEGMDLSQKSRLAAAAPVPAKNAQAPFTAARDPLPALLMLSEQEERRGYRSACDNTSRDVCYDLVDQRVVYRPVRQYMPRIDGLTAENVSLRHDKVVFKYTFK
jgi:hypothetical protein